MKKICTLLLLSCLTLAAYSQNFIWGGPGDANSEFNGGLNDWTTIGVSAVIPDSAVNAVWEWTPDGRLPAGTFWGDAGTIASASVANGAAGFNSDYLDNLGNGTNADGSLNEPAFGSGPAPACTLGDSGECAGHRGELWSPVIDCSGRETVVLKFSQSFRTFGGGASVEVSNGVDSMVYVVNEDVESNSGTARDVVLDISEIAANESNVVIKFIFEGDYYYWIIDDVQVLEKPGLDLAISDFFYPSLSAQTPASQIATDTFGFGAEVANLGANTQYDVELKVEIIRLENSVETVVYTDSIIIDSIIGGFGEAELIDETFDSDSLGVFFAETYAPELPEGLYFVQYSTSVDGATDFNEQDNVRFAPFRVTERTYATEFVTGLRSGLGGSSTSDFKAGNLYTTSSASQENYVVNSFTFAAFDNDGMEGKQVSLQLIEFNEDEVGPGFANFDFTSDATSDNPQLDLVGFANYTFTMADDQNSFITTEILDFKDDDFKVGAPLKSGNRYFAVASYATEGRGINHGIALDENEAPLYSGAFGTVFWDSEDSRWYGGFSNGAYWTFILRMDLDLLNSIDETPLPDASAKVFPNPTTEVLNLELNLEEQGHATVTLADLSGRVIKIDEIDNAQHEMKQYAIGEYTPGIYLIRVATELGTKTMRFVVTE